MFGPVGPIEVVALVVVLLGWVVPLVYWLKIKRTGKNSKELQYVALIWALAAVATVLAKPFAIFLIVGWLAVLIVGLVRLDTPRVGRVLVTMGAVWGVVILGVGLRVADTLLPSVESAFGAKPFDAAAYSGPKGSLDAGIQDLRSISAVFKSDGKTYSYSPRDGKMVMPAGQHHLVEIRLSKQDAKGNLWDASGAPRGAQPFEVQQNQTTKLPARGAITASISLDMKSGRTLSLSFALKDSSGGKWHLSGPPGTDPKFVALDSKGKQVWRSTFAYG